MLRGQCGRERSSREAITDTPDACGLEIASPASWLLQRPRQAVASYAPSHNVLRVADYAHRAAFRRNQLAREGPGRTPDVCGLEIASPASWLLQRPRQAIASYAPSHNALRVADYAHRAAFRRSELAREGPGQTKQMPRLLLKNRLNPAERSSSTPDHSASRSHTAHRPETIHRSAGR